MKSMSTILMEVGKKSENQWDNVPDEAKEVYTRSTEPLYAGNIPVETIQQKEAAIYNSIFGQYGLFKPVVN